MPLTKHGAPAETGIIFEVGISRYPRLGQRLAPETLRPLLAVSIPDGRVGSGNLLCDLDESAWERFSEKTCGPETSGIAAERIASAIRQDSIASNPRPAWSDHSPSGASHI